ncbi:MAG: 2'-5' RNA ligase family protein [Heteroscytonema crispum UTEX LB 1556]
MLTNYVEDTPHWQDWQVSYRFGTLSVFPPEEVRKLVNSLRQKYDPKSQSICDGHISLSIPFPRAVNDSDWAELNEKLSQKIEPFEVSYGLLRTYPPNPGVCYTIEPAQKFLVMRELIHSTHILSDVDRPQYNYFPHMTIAEFISSEETDKILN